MFVPGGLLIILITTLSNGAVSGELVEIQIEGLVLVARTRFFQPANVYVSNNEYRELKDASTHNLYFYHMWNGDVGYSKSSFM